MKILKATRMPPGVWRLWRIVAAGSLVACACLAYASPRAGTERTPAPITITLGMDEGRNVEVRIENKTDAPMAFPGSVYITSALMGMIELHHFDGMVYRLCGLEGRAHPQSARRPISLAPGQAYETTLNLYRRYEAKPYFEFVRVARRRARRGEPGVSPYHGQPCPIHTLVVEDLPDGSHRVGLESAGGELRQERLLRSIPPGPYRLRVVVAWRTRDNRNGSPFISSNWLDFGRLVPEPTP
jgi:hypothetical protein